MTHEVSRNWNFSNQLVGDFQMQVLGAIAELGPESYGAKVRQLIEDRSNRELHMPQVYAALKRLEKLGLVSSVIDEDASAGKRGRSRRVYELNASGQRMLDAGTMLSNPMPGIGVFHASASKGPVSP